MASVLSINGGTLETPIAPMQNGQKSTTQSFCWLHSASPKRWAWRCRLITVLSIRSYLASAEEGRGMLKAITEEIDKEARVSTGGDCPLINVLSIHCRACLIAVFASNRLEQLHSSTLVVVAPPARS